MGAGAWSSVAAVPDGFSSLISSNAAFGSGSAGRVNSRSRRLRGAERRSGVSSACKGSRGCCCVWLLTGGFGGGTAFIAFSVGGPGRFERGTGTASAGPTPAKVFLLGSEKTGSIGGGGMAGGVVSRRTNIPRSPRARAARAEKIGRSSWMKASTDGKRPAGFGCSAFWMAACSRPSHAGGAGGARLLPPPDLGGVVGGERLRAAQDEVQERAYREHIGPRIDGRAFAHLRRHPGQGGGVVVRAPAGHHQRRKQPGIQQPGVALRRHDHRARRQPQVEDAGRQQVLPPVGVGQRLEDVDAKGDGAVGRNGLVPFAKTSQEVPQSIPRARSAATK